MDTPGSLLDKLTLCPVLDFLAAQALQSQSVMVDMLQHNCHQDSYGSVSTASAFVLESTTYI
jgi:hypothetical protein